MDLAAPPPHGPGKPDWARLGANWPGRDHSRFVRSGGIVWHVQEAGEGPPLLLLHGTGASTHSWRGLAPLLARRYRLLIPDLPGHGFTETPSDPGLTLPGMAALIGGLCRDLGFAPELVIGHSAGAAVAVRAVLDGRLCPRAIVALNGALLPFPGPGSALFPALAKALFLNPFVPRLFAWTLFSDAQVRSFLGRATGSHIGEDYLRDYAALFRSYGHVAGALGMMANWDLIPLERDLPRLTVPLVLIAATGDASVPPSVSERAAALAPHGRVVEVPGLGHLAHEERPEAVAALIEQAAEEVLCPQP